MAGSCITGCVSLNVKERMRINSLKVKLNGHAKINWNEKRAYSFQSFETNISHSRDELHIDLVVTLVSKKKKTNGESKELYLESGRHSFPFEIQLPVTLPTSFEHPNAKIRYTLCSIIEMPWRLNETCKMMITIICLTDLNRMPRLRLAQTVSNTITVCCMCCRSAPIDMVLSVMKTGYVLGEAVVFNAVVNNRSRRKLGNVLLKLVQKVKLNSRSKSRTSSRVVTKIARQEEGTSGIEPLSRVEWTDSVLTIPSTCPSTMKSSKIIEINYQLVLYIESSWSHSWSQSDLSLKVPIIIGTIPFARQPRNHSDAAAAVQTPAQHQHQERSGLSADDEAPMHSPPLMFDDDEAADLPTYQQCVFANEDNVDFSGGSGSGGANGGTEQTGQSLNGDHGILSSGTTYTYTPLYPIYNRSSV